LITIGSLLGRQSAPLLGLDISSSSVKLVELGLAKNGGFVLERCAIEPLERGWINDGNVEKFDEVAEAMRRVVKKSGTRTRNVAMALLVSAVTCPTKIWRCRSRARPTSTSPFLLMR
jgi:type IV pilus assembly protein PilM